MYSGLRAAEYCSILSFFSFPQNPSLALLKMHGFHFIPFLRQLPPSLFMHKETEVTFLKSYTTNKHGDSGLNLLTLSAEHTPLLQLLLFRKSWWEDKGKDQHKSWQRGVATRDASLQTHPEGDCGDGRGFDNWWHLNEAWKIDLTLGRRPRQMESTVWNAVSVLSVS